VQTNSTQAIYVVFRTIDLVGTSSAYATIWDQFKVNWVELVFTPKAAPPIPTGISVSGTTTGVANTNVDDGWFYTCTDWDGWSTLTNYASISNHSGHKKHPVYKKSHRRFVPKVLMPIVNALVPATPIQNQTVPCGWETSVNALEHYGLWIGMPAGNSSSVPWQVDVQTRMCVSFRERQF